MPKETARVKLIVNNTEYDEWTSLHIKKSMNSLSGSFGFAVHNKAEGLANQWDISIGDECAVEINEQRLITGFIEDMPIFYDDDHIMYINGRDNTGDLVDCPHDSNINEWKNQALRTIIQNLCSPFGIEVVVDRSASSESSTIIPTFKANESIKVGALITRLCRDYGILALSIGDGKLTLTSESDDKSNDSINIGVNTSGATRIQNNLQRFSKYTVKGLGISNDNKSITDYTEPSGAFVDSTVARHRPMVILSESATDSGLCLRRAKWEARIRAGYSRATEYKLTSYAQSNGDLWRMNNHVIVNDIDNELTEEMLIAGIDYILDTKDGISATALIVPKNTFKVSDDEIDARSAYDA